MITGRDLLPLGAFFSHLGSGQRKQPAFIPSGIKAIMLASDIMAPNPITTTDDTDLADAAYIMLRNKISGLPVVDQDGILTGIVTKTDVVRALAAHA
jgi:predicted transcriptional regulator